VQGFENAGISGIHIEDQVTPKRCGLLPQGIPVISKDEQIIKIKAAVQARKNKDFFIIARTDAKSMYGLEEACQRAKSYIHAGADAAIVMGANTPNELQFASQFIQAPLVTVIQETPPTSILTDELLREVGCVMALHAGVARYAVVKALQTVLNSLHTTGSTASVQSMMATFDEYNDVLGLNEWLNVEKHFLDQ
jgi:methylisocitrate lyase